MDGVLEHSLFSQIRYKNEEILCKKIIIPELDDNVRLTVNKYREAIYKDIIRRYPEFNVKGEVEGKDEEGEELEKVGSVHRMNRMYYSLMSKNSSSSLPPRAKVTNSLMKQLRSKNQHKTIV